MASADNAHLIPDPITQHRVRICRSLVKERSRIGAHLGFELCPAPAWDILLDLYLSCHEDRVVHIWSLCIAAHIPTSTAHRKISEMVKAGVLIRGRDGGRVTITLCQDVAGKMDALFDELAKTSRAGATINGD